MFFAFSLLTSLWLGHLTLRNARRLNLGEDEGVGVQKFHSHWVPRLGGIPIFVAFFTGVIGLALTFHEQVGLSTALIVCLLPAFGIGLVEDFTRRAGVFTRLVFTMISAALGWWLLDAGLMRLDIPVIDSLLSNSSWAALVLTLVAVAGVAHAVNIIDGYNGLSGFYAFVVAGALAIVAGQVEDYFLMKCALMLAAALLGFLFWNFPYGKIFMGDAGAYLTGFLIAEISVLLVARNPQVSPWFPLLLMVYPVWETLYSMARRVANGLAQVGRPDALHLHHLIYRRLVKRWGGSRDPHHRMMRNSVTSLYVWGLSTLCAIPAILFWSHTAILMLFVGLFVVSYIVLYRRLVQFRSPQFLVIRAPVSRLGKVDEKTLVL